MNKTRKKSTILFDVIPYMLSLKPLPENNSDDYSWSAAIRMFEKIIEDAPLNLDFSPIFEANISSLKEITPALRWAWRNDDWEQVQELFNMTKWTVSDIRIELYEKELEEIKYFRTGREVFVIMDEDQFRNISFNTRRKYKYTSRPAIAGLNGHKTKEN